MNKELNKLLCHLDGKITSYRQHNQNTNEYKLKKLIKIQKEIQELYDIDKYNKGILKQLDNGGN